MSQDGPGEGQASALPDAVISWVADVAGGTVTRCIRVPGGASREAWFVDVTAPDGEQLPLFVRFDRHPKPPGGLFHPLRVEAEVFMALADTDVTVPRTLGVHPDLEAMLAERVVGDTWFYRIEDPDEQVRVAQDFIRNLAALHRLDPRSLELPSFGPVRAVREHVLDELGSMRRSVTAADGSIDPMLGFALDWLERNVPAYDGPTVLVQGDTGPGNFLYADGRVTAVVDWELAHFGDPMDDIAWLSLRTVQDTFTHFPDRLAEYEQWSGIEIDEERVWYYRLFAEMRMACHRGPGAAADPAVAASALGGRDVGNGLIYGMLHRRLLIEALAHVVGLDLPVIALPAEPPRSPRTAFYDACLDSLRAIVPRIDDPLAAQWSKGVARAVKYLREIDRSGTAFDEAECDDLGALLGAVPELLADGRSALADAVARGEVSDVDYVGYLWRQVCRDDHLMREASGALRTRSWPPLADSIVNGEST